MTPLRFFVTTSHSLLQVDLASRRIDPLHRGQGLYYGMTKCGEQLVVAARGRMVSSPVPASHERGQILVFDRKLQCCEVWEAPFPLRDMHQIAWIDERLFVTCSYDNMIAWRDRRGEWHQWFPDSRESAPPGRDINHFNTIAAEGEHIVVVAHNFENPSEILFFDRHQRDLQKRIRLGQQSHNVWCQDEEYMTCSSKEGLIVGHLGTHIDVGGFPRGVLRSGPWLIVGISELAERSARDLTHGKLRIFDTSRKPWVEVDQLILPREGLVLDIFPAE